MSNTDHNAGRRAEGAGPRAKAARLSLALLLSAVGVLFSGCRMDMQDQPRYEVYEPSKSFSDGQSSRPLVEGTIARGQLRDNALLYTGQARSGGGGGAQGRTASGSALSGAQSGTMPGGVGAAQPNMQAGGPGGGQATGDVNVRGNAAGGIPGGGGRMVAANPAAGTIRATGAAGGGANVATGPDTFPFPLSAEDLRQGQTRFAQFCSMCHGLTGNADGMIVRRGFRKPPSFHEDRLQEGQAPASHFFDVITNGWGAMPDYAAQITVEDRWKIIAYVRALQLSRRASVADVPAEKRGLLNGPAPAHEGGATEHGGGQH